MYLHTYMFLYTYTCHYLYEHTLNNTTTTLTLTITTPQLRCYLHSWFDPTMAALPVHYLLAVRLLFPVPNTRQLGIGTFYSIKAQLFIYSPHCVLSWAG
jgi:hypothetical protein